MMLPPSLSSAASEIIDVDADVPAMPNLQAPAIDRRPRLIEDDDDEFADDLGLEEIPEESLKAIEDLAKTQKGSSQGSYLVRSNIVASSSKSGTSLVRQSSNGKLPFRPVPQNAGPSARSVSAPGPSASSSPYNVSDHQFQRAPAKAMQTHLPFRADRSLSYPTSSKRERKVWDRTSYARTSRLTLGGGGKKKSKDGAATKGKGKGKAKATKGRKKSTGRNTYIDDMAGGDGDDDDEEELEDEEDEDEEEEDDDDGDEPSGRASTSTSKRKGKAPAKKKRKVDDWGLPESDEDEGNRGEEEVEGVWDAEGIDFDQFPMPLISGE